MKAFGTAPAGQVRVRKYDVRIDGIVCSRQSEEQVVDMFKRGMLTPKSDCRISGKLEWFDLNEFFPLLKYDSSSAVDRLPDRRPLESRSISAVDFEQDERKKPVLTSSLKAGWICFGLGVAIAWIFPPAYFFYSVALILAVVAMCTHQVNHGLILLLSSFVGMGTSAMISLFLAVGLFAHAVAPAVAKAEKDLEQQREFQRQLLATQKQALASISRSFATPVPVTAAHTRSITTLNKRQLFDEIARIEKQQRDLRAKGKDLAPTTREYLENLRTELDKGG